MIRSIAFAAAVLGIGLPAANVEIVVPGSVVEGKTIGKWTRDYHNWTGSIPPEMSPATDTTGANANENQSGPVFF